MALIALDDPHT